MKGITYKQKYKAKISIVMDHIWPWHVGAPHFEGKFLFLQVQSCGFMLSRQKGQHFAHSWSLQSEQAFLMHSLDIGQHQ